MPIFFDCSDSPSFGDTHAWNVLGPNLRPSLDTLPLSLFTVCGFFFFILFIFGEFYFVLSGLVFDGNV